MPVYENPLPSEDKARLDALLAHVKEEAKTAVGYPCNFLFDYSELRPFLEYSVNNVGDPFEKSNYRLNTHEMECEVIKFFGKLTQLPPEECWGYVTNGGSEGNLYGVFLARETLHNAMVYYSEDTHYSVGKAMRILEVNSIMIRRQDNGEFDYDDLRESIKIHRDMPAIVFVTIGTTMTGAVDNVPLIKDMLKDMAMENHYIHADGALSGMILPFVDDPQPWDFASGIDSISISGHKFIGSPVPCGVVLAKRRNMERIARFIEYVGALDTTLTGSRNAITPIYLWYAIKRHGMEGFREMVRGCIDTAEYAVTTFKKQGIDAWRNKNSITVVFPKPSQAVLDNWQIAIHGKVAHIITMPHVTRDTVDRILQDMLDHPVSA